MAQKDHQPDMEFDDGFLLGVKTPTPSFSMSFIKDEIDPKEMIEIPDRLFFKIGDVAKLIDVKPYVLRYWETEFSGVSPQKSNSGQRVYRRSDVEMLLLIKYLLYKKRYSIEGAKKRIQELRKIKELKSFTKDKVLGSVPLVQENLKKVLTLLDGLKNLIQIPTSEIFKY